MQKLYTLVISIALLALIGVNLVSADEYNEIIDREGRVNVPGQQISVSPLPAQAGTPMPQENIPQASGEIKDGVMTVALNFSEATKFAIKTEAVCGAVNNIIVETNKGFTGLLKVSKASQSDTESLDRKIGDCQFNLEGFDNSLIENINWTLKVARKDLETKDISLNNVKLIVTKEEEMNPVKTETTDNSNSEYVIYEAQTDNFEDGIVAVAESKNNIFTAKNIAYVVFSVLGLLVLVAIGYLLLKRED
jgi:hypothetical protein